MELLSWLDWHFRISFLTSLAERSLRDLLRSIHSIKMSAGLRSLIADTLEEDRASGGKLLSDARRDHAERALERFDALVEHVDRRRSIYEAVPLEGMLEVHQVSFGDSGPQSGDFDEFLRYRAAQAVMDLTRKLLSEFPPATSRPSRQG